MSMNGGELKCLIQPPTHPTYDLKGIINLALQEDSGDRGDVTSLATVPAHLQTEAYFLAKENGVIAGIALADMIFMEVDSSLKVCIYLVFSSSHWYVFISLFYSKNSKVLS